MEREIGEAIFMGLVALLGAVHGWEWIEKRRQKKREIMKQDEEVK